MPITRARQELCPLVKDLSQRSDGVVGIMVGEEVGAYLVSPATLRELEEFRATSGTLPRPSIAGTVEILVDDLGAALKEVRHEAEAELLASAGRRHGRTADGE
jgi:hypothetical protein